MFSLARKILRSSEDNPQLILADEPMGILDSRAGQAAIELLTGSILDSATTVVVVSHDLRIDRFAHRVILMEGGSLQE